MSDSQVVRDARGMIVALERDIQHLKRERDMHRDAALFNESRIAVWRQRTMDLVRLMERVLQEEDWSPIADEYLPLKQEIDAEITPSE